MPVELQIAFGLISTITVIGGFVFAAYQFAAFVRQRRQETALTLMRTTQALIASFRCIWRTTSSVAWCG